MRVRAPASLLLFLSAACYSSIPTDFNDVQDASSSSSAELDGSTGDVLGDDTSESSGEMVLDETEPTGPELFAMYCAACHGPSAEGTALAYELRHPDRRLATWVIRNGREGLEFPDSQMPSFSPEVIDDTQLDALLDWLDGFEQPSTGEALYLDYCANCHGRDPRMGGVIREDILEEDDEDILDTVRDGDGDGLEPRSEYMSAFPSSALSDAEVQAIIDWMRGRS